jgi:predicted dienelactone hydrolase
MRSLRTRCRRWSHQVWICLTTVGVFLAGMLASCGTPAPIPSTAATMPIPSTAAATPVPPTATVQDTTAAAEVESTGEPVPFPLSEPGPYYTGKRTFTFEDASRDGREIRVTVFYPALRPEGSTGPKLLAGTNRDPDLSGAPYPLILTEQDTGGVLQSHLASYGFVRVAVVSYSSGQEEFFWIDNVRDFLFALNQIGSDPPEGLAGVIDSDHVGVMGHSYGGDLSLVLSGVRVDPEFYLAQCKEELAKEPESVRPFYGEFICADAQKWDQFAAYAGDEITASDDGLWQPITDERIRAVMPSAPSISWYFGERGLAAADRPTFLLCGTEDTVFSGSHYLETVYTFEHLGAPERFMVSLIGKGHFWLLVPEEAKRLKHFATAFFGYHLQGKSEYRDYFSEEFVSQFDDLAWGVYEGER